MIARTSPTQTQKDEPNASQKDEPGAENLTRDLKNQNSKLLRQNVAYFLPKIS